VELHKLLANCKWLLWPKERENITKKNAEKNKEGKEGALRRNGSFKGRKKWIAVFGQRE